MLQSCISFFCVFFVINFSLIYARKMIVSNLIDCAETRRIDELVGDHNLFWFLGESVDLPHLSLDPPPAIVLQVIEKGDYSAPDVVLACGWWAEAKPLAAFFHDCPRHCDPSKSSFLRLVRHLERRILRSAWAKLILDIFVLELCRPSFVQSSAEVEVKLKLSKVRAMVRRDANSFHLHLDTPKEEFILITHS